MPRKITCTRCFKSLNYYNYREHLNTCHGPGRFCPICCLDINFEDEALTEHLLNCQRIRYPCGDCEDTFTTAGARNAHHCPNKPGPSRKRRRTKAAPVSPNTTSAVDGLFKIIDLQPTQEEEDGVNETLINEKERILDVLRYEYI